MHGDPNKPHEATGHVLTTSAQLDYTSSPPISSPQVPPTIPSFEGMPADVLNRLLDLAPDVCSPGEATPVQAWHYVRSQPYFGGLSLQSLRRLAERLCEVIKCHGYVFR
ncbi:hypothetical protein IMZ48_04535 [Candidatus Bathyarchaeota archaeon]|nr:hypothetical protein [Candidatus Bathyarchaeota archaeon]